MRATCAQPSERFDVAQIVCNDWWQGSVLKLPENNDDSHFGGHSCWVLASQTCNAHNPDIERVPTVEFIRAYPLPGEAFNEKLANGSSPRILHARATSADGDVLDLELKIEERIWVPRQRLIELLPSVYRFEDSESDVSRRDKEAFAAWLSRSYVRVELPNDFIELFSTTKLKEFFSNVAKKYSERIQGIYFDVRPRTDTSGAIYSPTQVAKFSGPYQLHVTVVVQDSDAVDAIEAELATLAIKRIPIPGVAGGKMSRADASAEKGIDITTDVVTIDGWTVRDLMGSIRFTDWDHLSGSEETDL